MFFCKINNDNNDNNIINIIFYNECENAVKNGWYVVIVIKHKDFNENIKHTIEFNSINNICSNKN